jgi:hypothetical protein
MVTIQKQKKKSSVSEKTTLERLTRDAADFVISSIGTEKYLEIVT